MGQLRYGSNLDPIILDDRLLWHLKVVIVSKLRRQEPFSFSWTNKSGSSGAERSSIWLHPASDLRFDWSTRNEGSLNKAWLEALMLAANSSAGLSDLAEPAAAAVRSAGRSN
jgi:hypothetical protein